MSTLGDPPATASPGETYGSPGVGYPPPPGLAAGAGLADPPRGLPVPGLPPPPGQRSDGDIPMWVLLAVGGVVLVLAAATAFFFVKPLLDGTDDVRTYPESWDPRVAPYVKIVERERDLQFRHPVEVRFLPDEEFEESVTGDRGELTDEQRREIEQATGMLRALGLLTGDVDLFEASNQATGGSLLAYYSFVDETVTVRGTKIRPEMRQTIVHELTHVLQDQNFRLGERFLDLQDDETSSTEETVLRAIVEGDAERVAALYRESLTPKQRARLDAGRQRENDQADKRLEEVPTILMTLMGAPYSLGSAMVQTAAQEDGNDAIDELLRTPPRHDIALVRPVQELRDATEAPDLDPPSRPEGSEELAAGELGALVWYLMLAERIPLTDALGAVDGWSGDAFVAYDDEGTACIKARYAARTRADGQAMFTALKRWTDADPGAKAGVKLAGRSVKFRSCDPGADAAAGADASQRAVQLALTRTYLSLALMRAGTARGVAACVADRSIRVYSLEQLNDPTFGADDPAVRERVRRMGIACS